MKVPDRVVLRCGVGCVAETSSMGVYTVYLLRPQLEMAGHYPLTADGLSRAREHALSIDVRHARLKDPLATASRALVEQVQRMCRVPGVELKLHPLQGDQHACATFGFAGPQVWIQWLQASIPGAGAVTMQKLVDLCDRLGILLRLHCDDAGSDLLYAYYERFGFLRDPAGGEIMERLPRRASEVAAGEAVPGSPQRADRPRQR